AYNEDLGIGMALGGGAFPPVRNLISQNSMFENVGPGITLDEASGVNGGILAPVLLSAKRLDDGTVTLDYTLTPHGLDLTVEVFNSDADSEEGRSFLTSLVLSPGSVTANQSNRVQFDGSSLVVGDRLVATVTDSDGNTSEFSGPLTVVDFVPRGYTVATVVDEGFTPVDRPRAVEAAPNGDFLVASNGVVARYDQNGIAYPGSVADFGAGTIVDDLVQSDTELFAIHDQMVERIGGSGPTFLADATGGAIGRDGYLYVVAGPEIYASGDQAGSFVPFSTAPAGVIALTAIVFDADGNLYVSGISGGGVATVLHLEGRSTYSTVWTLQDLPSSLAFAEDGRLYATTATQVLSGKPSDLAPTEFMALPAASGFENSLAIGPKSRLFVAHEERGQVYRFSLPESQDVVAELTFRLSPSLEAMLPGAKAAVNDAFTTWRTMTGAQTNVSLLIAFDAVTPGVDQASIGDSENTITLGDDPLFLGRSTLGVASKLLRVGPSGDPESAKVVSADIVLNARFHPVTGSSGELGAFSTAVSTKDHDIQGVVTHELGHVLGLIHAGPPSSTMFYNLPKDARDIKIDDRAALLRKYADAGVESGYGSIAGQVTSGNVATPGMPVGGALVIAIDVNDPTQSVHAYSDRNGNYAVRFLPAGTYRLGLFALDGSVFADKIPLTPARISRTMDTYANERDFLEEYWNGTNESADDDRSEVTEISVGTNVETANFVTNIDTAPPTVARIVVGQDPEAASLNPTISLTFSERVVESTITAMIRPVGGTTAEPLQLTLSKTGRKVAVATPPNELLEETSYVVTISGTMDDAGNVQSSDFTSVFTTRPPDQNAPTVVSSIPAADQQEVSPFSLVTVTFSEAMKSASITNAGNVVLRAAGGSAVTGRVDIPASNVLAFSPDAALAEGTVYEVVLTNLQDVPGNTMPQAILRFETAADSQPTLLDFGPANMAGNISPETKLFLDFSEPIAVPVEPATYPVMLERNGSVITGEFVLINDGTRLVFTPTESLDQGVSYDIVVSPGLEDASTLPVDVDLDGDVPGVQTFRSWAFSTGSDGFSLSVLSPSTAALGSIVTIEGTGFSPEFQQNAVTFSGGATAEVTRSTVSSITAVVPDGAQNGPVTVTVPSGSGNTLEFTLYVEPATFDTALKLSQTESAPTDVEVSPDGTIAIVPNSKSGTVSLINVDTGEVRTVTVEDTPLRVALTPDGERAYVTNYNSQSVSVIDVACGLATGLGCVQSIPVGFNPIGIDIAPDGSRVYVANYSSKSVSVIDAIPTSGTFNKAIRTIKTDEAVTEVFTDPDGAIRYLTSEAGTSASEASPDGALGRLQTDSSPTDVEAHPDGTGIFVGTNFGAIAIEVNLEVDPANWGVTLLVTDSHSSASEISPDGGVTILRTDGSGSSTQTDPDGAGRIASTESTVSDVEASPDGTVVHFVTGGGELLIYAIPESPYSGEYQAITRTGTDAAASEVETSPDGSLLYVTSYETSTVSIYKFGAGLSSAESDPIQVAGSDYGLVLLEVIQVGLQPQGLAYSPVNNIAVIANTGSDNVTILSFESLTASELEGDTEIDPDANLNGIPDSRESIAAQLDLLEETAPKKDGKDYEKALKHAEANLDAKLWTEEANPSEKHGNKVFDNDKQILKALQKVIERNGFETAIAAALTELTVQLDRDIATLAIESAQADIDALVCDAGKKGQPKASKCDRQLESAQKELEKALAELDKAEDEIAQGDIDKAVDHFKMVWEHAAKSSDDAAGKGFFETEEELPLEFDLSPNYPNPFNPVTTIEFALPESIDVRLEVFDVLGRRVQTLVNGPMDAGYHSVQFNAERLASGIYLYRIQAGAYAKVQRMVLMK
ncbi:MAG: YVTN family beta-propeller protein, partial [Thalassolituus oleivorans]